MSTFQKAREALGLRLRELRLDAKLTGRTLAAANGWHPTKVSKIENGKITPSVDDVEAWTRACGVPGQARELVTRLRTLESYYVEHRRLFRAGMAPRQRAWTRFEDESAVVRNFEPVFIPGLLQTAPYAWQRLATGHVGHVPDDVDEAVAVRMQRQQVLYRADKRFEFVVTEAALRYRLAPVDVMAGQLDRLVSALSIPSVQLGVIPMSAELPVPPVHGFHLFDKAVIVELLTSSVTITEATEIADYEALFSQFGEVAVYGSEARDVIVRVQADTR